jgi:hypothetical protein
MWQSLMDWLPDLEWTLEFGDLINVIVAIIAVILSIQAYRISKKQDRILEQQAKKRANLVLSQSAVGVFNASDSDRYALQIHNVGTRTVDDCNWAIYFHEHFVDKVVLRIEGGTMQELSTSLEPAGTMNPDLYRQMTGRLTVPIRPARSYPLGEVVVMHGALKGLVLLWSIDCEDGVFPEPKGVGEVQVIYDADDLNV